MKRVFISSNKDVASTGFEITNDFDVLNLPLRAEHQDGETAFIIDVHCTFKTATRMQHQGGILIYRQLLKAFSDCQDKLKVVFYSPISKNELVMLKPENYVLHLLPFVELFPNAEHGNDTPSNWSFDKALNEELMKVCPQFNNASENLLSGWALANQKMIMNGEYPNKLQTNGKRLLFIDDQQSEWKVVFDIIFEDSDIVYIKNRNKEVIQSQKEYRLKLRTEWDDYIRLVLKHVKMDKPDLILSDLYLDENHEETKPFKSLNDIDSISGFKVFKEIKQEYPFLPYMIYTTSNKIWNAEAFRSKGVWAWGVKDNTIFLSNEDKVAQFTHFENSIKKLANLEWGFAARVWKDVIVLQEKVCEQEEKSKIWWYDDCPQSLEILKDCLITLDTIYAQRSQYETMCISDFDARQCFQIFNNLGGLCELLNVHHGGHRKKTVGVYLYLLRSFYSHRLFYKSAKPIEAIFCIDLLLKLLELDVNNFKTQPKNAGFVLERTFVTNTNLNYLLQLESLVSNIPQFKYDKKLFTELKKSFRDVRGDVISTNYSNVVNDHQKVIFLVEQFKNPLSIPNA